jgi:hypothetical protein
MGKLTISMAIFNSYVKLPEGSLPWCVFERLGHQCNTGLKMGYTMGKWSMSIYKWGYDSDGNFNDFHNGIY